MRTEESVISFAESLAETYGDEDPRVQYEMICYEACIPKTFWNVTSRKVTHNREAFDDVINPYRRRWKTVLRHGYSLLLLGDNGTGKTMFISYLLIQAIKRGQTAYYTTMAQLDRDIKKGFRDNDAVKRLEHMLDSDFFAIDEMGKENFKQDSYLMGQFEMILKKKYDDGEPVMLASNIDYEEIVKMYGSSIESMFEGRYKQVALSPGDFRKSIKAKMKKDMRWS